MQYMGSHEQYAFCDTARSSGGTGTLCCITYWRRQQQEACDEQGGVGVLVVWVLKHACRGNRSPSLQKQPSELLGKQLRESLGTYACAALCICGWGVGPFVPFYSVVDTRQMRSLIHASRTCSLYFVALLQAGCTTGPTSLGPQGEDGEWEEG